MDRLGFDFLERLASHIGVTEPALRLLLCLFLGEYRQQFPQVMLPRCPLTPPRWPLSGFPGALFYRKFIFPLPKLQNHVYFIVSGLALCLFNFGWGTVHSLVSVLVTYLMIKLLPHGLPLRAASFLFHMGYILVGE